MKALLLLFSFLIASLSIAQDCSNCAPRRTRNENVENLRNISAQERRQFMARESTPAGWTLGLRIESNFKIPLVGSQNYFGRIFFKRGENHIKYRDEQIARKHYDDERRGGFFTSRYNLAEINSRNGSSVAPGVRITGQNLNSNRGGRLTIAANRLQVPIDITVNGNRAIPSITVNGQRIVFDTMKINARRGGIIAGVSNVQLLSRGRVVHTITN